MPVWEDGDWVWMICVGKCVESVDAVVPDWEFVWSVSGCWRWCRLVSGAILSARLDEMFSGNGSFWEELLRHRLTVIVSNVGGGGLLSKKGKTGVDCWR